MQVCTFPITVLRIAAVRQRRSRRVRHKQPSGASHRRAVVIVTLAPGAILMPPRMQFSSQRNPVSITSEGASGCAGFAVAPREMPGVSVQWRSSALRAC